ncbi:hypothetical protein [Paenibacillus prosopidis]|uniref:Uncharacterized protein n=1 Tax=Paenibacillus prosopidis TaxID=630520 RepID=A0A368VJK8_9BACL|nr:hypothetical protein [Paenibacillus prosopidis]RCW41602.1 hypothetical protein DFP97_12238 [Paenibacillus prosopidis]
MASMKQVVRKYGNRVIKMFVQSGRTWDSEESWESNIEGLEGASELSDSFHKEMKSAWDWKEDMPDLVTRSNMIEAITDERFCN